MGLAAPKKRLKLSHDPNNTAWTNDSSSFGLKMMTQQGWQPGNLLGAKDAPHAEFHTAANASHIRVMLKDDNLGLGAKIGSGVGHGECTGLDVFKNILGRLNGRDEDELVKEQKSRDDSRRAIYTERKWGSQRFVSGGFLIGDKIQDLIDGEAERLRKISDGSSSDSSDSSDSESEEEAPAPVEKTKKSKKRKTEAIEEEPEVVAIKVKKSKKKRKSEASPDDAEEVAIEVKKAKKSKRERKSNETHDTSDDSESRKRKREKKERRKEKETKRERKENDKLNTVDEELSTKESKKKSKRDKKKSNLDSILESSNSSNVTTKESTPTIPITASSSGRSTPMMQGRHAVRSRNIAQKRLAHMDVAALNQIFMIKS